MCTIGCDPELVIRVESRERTPNSLNIITKISTLNARDICPDLIEDRGRDGSFGRDGARWLFEIRPAPSINPSEIVRRTGILLANSEQYIRRKLGRTDYFKNFTFNIGSWEAEAGGIGGHFHQGKSYRNEETVQDRKVCLGLSLLWSLEDYNSGVARRKGMYGQLDDIRAGAGNRTTEFRTPSSDWLAKPSLAKAVLSYFRSLAMSTNKIFVDNEEMYGLFERGLTYWTGSYDNDKLSPKGRDKYLDSILKEVKKAVNKKDLSTITFFVDKIESLRDSTKLIPLDSDKWRAAASCVD